MILKTPLDIGLLVKGRRKALGLTQDALATRLGVSRLWIVQLEQGKPTVQLDLVLRALNDLDVPLTADPTGTVSKVRQDAAAQLDAIIREAAGEYRV